MTLPASPNTITLAMVNTELGYASNAYITLNDSAVRTLAGKATGAISMSDLHGKSAGSGDVWQYSESSPYSSFEIAQSDNYSMCWWTSVSSVASGFPSTDGLGRPYLISGAYRYTRGAWVTWFDDGTDFWDIHWICRTASGTQPAAQP